MRAFLLLRSCGGQASVRSSGSHAHCLVFAALMKPVVSVVRVLGAVEFARGMGPGNLA